MLFTCLKKPHVVSAPSFACGRADRPRPFRAGRRTIFPLEALREALVNAFCHRDYTISGGAVSLAIYDDRLEIWSDGTLPFNLKPEDLKRDHASRPRNPIIAQVFYLRGMIERWGRGTQKIVELCVKAGHPEPEFGEQAGSVWVCFLPSGYIAPHRVGHDLTDRQREILHVLARSKHFAFREIRQSIDNPPPERTLREDLIHFKKLGLVQMIERLTRKNQKIPIIDIPIIVCFYYLKMISSLR